MYEVKRFRQLLEAKLGNVKTLLTEEDQVDVPETDINGKPFPSCVRQHNWKAELSSDKGYYSVIGGPTESKNVDWTGYRLYSNYRTKNPEGNMEYYFCRGDYPTLGQKAQVSKKGVVNTTDLGGKLLKVGSTGEVVKKVQNFLLSGGHGDENTFGGVGCSSDINKCDGNYNKSTKEAVRSYQDNAGATSKDGIVGDETWQLMFGGENTADRKSKRTADEALAKLICSVNPGISGDLRLWLLDYNGDALEYFKSKNINVTKEAISAAKKYCVHKINTIDNLAKELGIN